MHAAVSDSGRSSRLTWALVVAVSVAASAATAAPTTASVDAPAAASPTLTPRAMRHFVLPADDPRFEFFPITNYVNTAFDTAQVSRAFSQDDYWHNQERVLDRLVHPLDSIDEDGGWDHLFRQEAFSSHVLPNLTLHLLGNGYDFRTLAEWYDQHAVRFPYFWAFLTSYAGYLGNEAIEISNDEINATDHIADLYFFNPLGNLLFMSDTWTQFAQDTLQMRNWTGQPVFDARHREIINASNNYVLRPSVYGDAVRPFLYFGLHYFAGVSARISPRSSLSFGAGLATKDPFEKKNFDKVQPSGGIFWDEQDRLVASAIFNSTDNLVVRANLYPEAFRNRACDVGFFLGLSDHAVPAFGLSVQKLLAVGFR